MAPKKKSGVSAPPSTSKALAPVAANATGGAEACKDVDAAGDVVGAGGAVTTSPAADAGAGGAGLEQHQHHPGAGGDVAEAVQSSKIAVHGPP